MTDDQILEVVQAHKEGKKIESRASDHDWHKCEFPNWDFYRVEFRVAPEPRKEWIVRDGGGGYISGWDHTGKFWTEDNDTFRVCRVEEETSGEPMVISSAMKTFPETERKPREWLIKLDQYGNHSGFIIPLIPKGEFQLQQKYEEVRVREVLE